jgi:hypothetical protein
LRIRDVHPDPYFFHPGSNKNKREGENLLFCLFRSFSNQGECYKFHINQNYLIFRTGIKKDFSHLYNNMGRIQNPRYELNVSSKQGLKDTESRIRNRNTGDWYSFLIDV